jgi:hypothetical protein
MRHMRRSFSRGVWRGRALDGPAAHGVRVARLWRLDRRGGIRKYDAGPDPGGILAPSRGKRRPPVMARHAGVSSPTGGDARPADRNLMERIKLPEQAT